MNTLQKSAVMLLAGAMFTGLLANAPALAAHKAHSKARVAEMSHKHRGSARDFRAYYGYGYDSPGDIFSGLALGLFGAGVEAATLGEGGYYPGYGYYGNPSPVNIYPGYGYGYGYGYSYPANDWGGWFW